WRDGRVAEGDGLLNRYTVKSRIGGSNPPLSASSNFSRLGTSSVKPVLLSSVKTQSSVFFCVSVWSELSPFRPVFSQFSEAGSEGSKGVIFSSSPNKGRLITSVYVFAVSLMSLCRINSIATRGDTPA